MKITGIRTILYEFEQDRPIGDANSPRGRQRSAQLAVFVDTDEGIYGEAMGSSGAAGIMHGMARDLLVGEDPRCVRGLWQRMVDLVFKGNNRGTVTDAISALDVALWDLKAKANDEPLWKTLGAAAPRARAYASGIDMPLSDAELAEFYTRMAAQGIAGGKLKVGLDMETDLRRLRIMRDALATSGKVPELMVDSNEYWSPKQAIRYLSRMEEEFDLTWAEEPARRWDYRGLRQVSQGIRAAVATGENLDHVSEFVPLIMHEAVDVVEVGWGCSGITGALTVAELAYAFELPVSMMNCPGNFMAHVAAVLPNHIAMEVVAAGRTKAMSVDNHIEDGWIVLGDKPGHGLSFDMDKLAALAVEKPSPTAGASPWGRREGAGLYVVPPRPDEQSNG